MIIIMPLKQFTKNAEKLVKPKDYWIMDCTDNEEDNLQKYTNVISLDGLAPPPKLINGKKNEDEIDEHKLEKMEDKFFSSDDFVAGLLAIIKAYVDSDEPVNIFVVLTKGGYKYYAKKIIKKLYKVAGDDDKFIFTWEDLKEDKKILSSTLSNKKIKSIAENHKKIIKKLSGKKKKKK